MDFTGKNFGSYRLIRVLGSGGFAVVYEGVHIWLGTHVAVKVLKTHVNPRNFREIRRCLKEALVANRLKHPHIIPILDCNIQQGIPYIVMPLMKNGSLSQMYPEGVSLPWNTIIEYVQQVAETLTFIHANNFIHQDVKPENMLVGDDGSIFLSDFGTVALIKQTNLYFTRSLIGTVRYMAPEGFTNYPPTPASDIYSLAIVVFEWLTGEQLFSGPTSALIHQHIFVIPSSRRMTALGIKPPIQRVLLKALAKNPRDRFQTASEFYTALESAGHEVEQDITKSKSKNKLRQMSFIFALSIFISVFLGIGLCLVGVTLAISLLSFQVCLLLLPVLIALLYRNLLAVRYSVVMLLIAGLIGVALHSWFSFWWAFPILLLMSSITGLLRWFRK